MKPSAKVEAMLNDLGFELQYDFQIIRGPKSKMDVIECWHVQCAKGGAMCEVASCFTLSELARKGIRVLEVGKDIPEREAQIYGQYLVEPKQ